MMFVELPFIPETPTRLVGRTRREDAEEALCKTNKGNPGYDPSTDLALPEEEVRRDQENSEDLAWISLLTHPAERRKLLFSCGGLFTSQINGIIFFYVYGVVFAQGIGIEEPFVISTITNTLQISAVGASVSLSNEVRKRTNMVTTSVIMILAFIVIGDIGTQWTISTVSQYIIMIFSYFVIVACNFAPGPLACTIARENSSGQ
ncbi:uncharacterized protein Z518_01328 [Rhinocladiella mackenziei CBS 650.93]|uniref:Major facilitator superfamily (MFS) profile domain-containing protein n=1 Tax=Rhinocladiella mackenziei CBS 650.93 TaxID=1442369 RepID=A0A0D2G5Q8_9EURO|nr:uncharacterized protein Z518_01328 [Rhinocladiella mackenziei CBS 650.93]KIX10247.1 hypothetical protein Z518_01328 [Rhinocladiella mackenziei CBS 650.93]